MVMSLSRYCRHRVIRLFSVARSANTASVQRMQRLMLALFGALTLASLASPADAYDSRSNRTISALTDSLVDAESRGGQMMNGLARHLDPKADVRVLAVAGRGGVGNLKDLLFLRGVDLAVVNADVLSSIAGSKLGELAKRELRYVTKLYDQRVLLIARSSITSIDQLAGKVIAIRSERPDTQTTAETLFRLLQVPVRFEAISGELQAPPAHDAMLLLESELPQTSEFIERLADYRLLPIPFDNRIGSTYRPAQVASRELPGLTAGRPILTVRVDTILAIYNWRTASARRADVLAFVAAFYASLPQLRKAPDGMLWRQIGVTSDVPGWTRYTLAEPSRYLEPAKLAEITTVSRAAFLPGETVVPADDGSAAKPAEARQPPPFAILAIERPPFSSQQLPDGGPALKMVRQALELQNRTHPIAIEWVTSLVDEPLLRLIESNRFDVIVPWPYFPCDQPSRLTGPTAHVCDSARFSKPLFTDILRLFLPVSSPIDLGDPTTLTKRRICIADTSHIAIVTATHADWERLYEVEYVVRPSIVACLIAAQQGEADGIVASEAESNHALDVLGIRQSFKPSEQPVGIQSWTAVVPNDRPAELLADIDNGLQSVRDALAQSGSTGGSRPGTAHP